jgi:hypothetical protein
VRYVLVGAFSAAGMLAAAWTLWFLALLAFGNEGALPPKWRIPDVPAGATVVEQSRTCGSGGCWWQLILRPPPGQTPQDLARDMGLSREQHEWPALLDPGFVAAGAEARDDELVVHVGYE